MLILIVLALGALGLLAVAARAVRRGWNDDRPVRLNEVLSRTGLDFSRFASEATAYQYAVAASRCHGCSRAARCRRWLASGARDGFQDFCPNAGFVQSARRPR